MTGSLQNGYASNLFGCQPCGTLDAKSFNLGGTANGGPTSPAAGEFNGVSYAALALGFDLHFTGPTFNSADFTGSSPVLEGPFSMSGTINGWTSPRAFGPPQFTAAVNGVGLASARFFGPVPSSDHGNLYTARDVTYTFAPAGAVTPEPASLLLLATGIAPLILRRRR